MQISFHLYQFVNYTTGIHAALLTKYLGYFGLQKAIFKIEWRELIA